MKLTLLAAAAALLALPALAHDGVHVIDPYARVIGPSGAAFFRIVNDAGTADRLVSASSPDAGMVMLMNDKADANGVMQMTMVDGGFPVDAGGQHLLASAGDHVMLMDLTRSVRQGDSVTLVLTFEHAGALTVTVPVDNTRRTEPGQGPTPQDAASAP